MMTPDDGTVFDIGLKADYILLDVKRGKDDDITHDAV
jgi:hypothetical protein